MVVDQAQQ
jgi:hypothetical protein